MLEGWSFLIAEIWVLLAIALLAGLVAGWLLFGRRHIATGGGAEAELNETRAHIATLQAEIARLQMAETKDAPTVLETPSVTPKKPRRLKTARKGGPDDLKQIKGIGPELEKLCHSLGYFHFGQIAKWTASEVAWVDENLEGFHGRVTRDDWVKQAQKLTKSGS
ncbi:MAG: hypothetical protein AAGJ34_13510 [Pseudomonadota bacterium]